MKRAFLPILLVLPLVNIGGCSAEDNPVTVPGTAGTTSTGTAGTPATSGGSTATAGTDPGTAGTAPVAGTTGTSGSTGTGGGGSDSGGSSAAGTGTGGSGTAGTAAGGMAGTATGGGGSGTGGSGGTGTAGTGGVASTPVSVGKLDGMLVTTPCGDTPTGDDCAGGGWVYEGVNTPCSGGKLDSDGKPTVLDFPITGGEKGKHYMATMHFYGIMEPKNYGNAVTREAGNTRPNEKANPSTPEPFGTANGGASLAITDYNNYEIHSFDDTGKEIKVYVINSDTQQGHWTFAISYERPIEIVAGGKVHVRVYDNNCRMIKNCEGGSGGPPCSGNARTIDISAANPQPTGLMQPGLGKAVENSGQWFLIDVKDIVAKP